MTRPGMAQGVGVLACAVAAWGAWYGEIVYRFGGPGLKWLHAPDSPDVICPLIAVGVMVALGSAAHALARVAFVGMASLIFFASYTVAGAALAELHTTLVTGTWALARLVGAVVVAWLLTSTGLFVAVGVFLEPIARRSIAGAAAALVLVVPASLLSVMLYSRGGHDYIHAVKMGYPVFWTALFLPAALALARGPERR